MSRKVFEFFRRNIYSCFVDTNDDDNNIIGKFHVLREILRLKRNTETRAVARLYIAIEEATRNFGGAPMTFFFRFTVLLPKHVLIMVAFCLN